MMVATTPPLSVLWRTKTLKQKTMLIKKVLFQCEREHAEVYGEEEAIQWRGVRVLASGEESEDEDEDVLYLRENRMCNQTEHVNDGEYQIESHMEQEIWKSLSEEAQRAWQEDQPLQPPPPPPAEEEEETEEELPPPVCPATQLFSSHPDIFLTSRKTFGRKLNSKKRRKIRAAALLPDVEMPAHTFYANGICTGKTAPALNRSSESGNGTVST